MPAIFTYTILPRPHLTVVARSPEAIKAYQSLVGALLYAAINTRPEVAYAVGMLCRAMAKPTPELHAAAKRVLGYLYRTREIGLRYQANDKPLFGMTDSDWAVKHSTSGFVFIYNSAAITWGSKEQTSVALSSFEAELMAASLAATEAVHLKTFLDELNVDGDEPISVACYNTAARDTAYNPEHLRSIIKRSSTSSDVIFTCASALRIIRSPSRTSTQ